MIKTLYVGNLPFNLKETEIREAFALHGKVHSVKLITNILTGASRGFGFVQMDEQDADSAITAMHSVKFMNRNLRVHPTEENLFRS